jgi:membrane associated rhomboid family serine protease
MAGFTAETGRALGPDLKGQGMHRYRTSPGMGFGGLGITPAVKGLLIANVAIFLLQNVVRDIGYWGVFNTQVAIFNMQLWRFVTYMFLHGDFSHLLFNMFGLWMFGSQIEALWGQRSFLTFYFVCGLGGAFLYALFDLIGIGDGASMLGASGAIYGILLAYGMTFPNNIILVGFIFPIKAKYAVILFGLVELMATASGSGGGVAHLAHLGGMLAGFIFIMLTIPGISRQMSAAGLDLGGVFRRFKTKRKIKVVRPEPRSGNGRDQAPPPSAPGSADQKQIDRILDKISREGLQSLSDEEQEILRRAGRR